MGNSLENDCSNPREVTVAQTKLVAVEVVKKWLDSRYILKKEPTRFGCEKTEEEKGVNNDSKVFGLK